VRKIFISYRRAEAEYAAGALARDLREHFGDEQVFRDKEDIGGGVAWKQEIVSEINPQAAMLVLIGKDWLSAKNVQGQRRLDTADDPIRMEIAGGLARGARVIPVLLENAVMPAESDLPADLQGLSQFNALQLRDSDWQYDLSKISKTLEKAGFAPMGRLSSPSMQSTRADAPDAATSTNKPRGASAKLITSYVLSVLALITFKETHDRSTFMGLAIFGIIALALALFAYRDYRQGKASGPFGPYGAIGLGALVALGYISYAVDAPPNEAHNIDPAALAEKTNPVAAVSSKLAEDQRIAPVATKNAPAMNAANALNPAMRSGKAGPELAAQQLAPNNPGVERKLPDLSENADRMQATDVSGRWRDSEDNTAIMFSQQGNNVHMVATQQGIAIEGLGTISGRQVHMALSMAGIPFSEMRLTLSPDGRALHGAMITQGQQEQVHFIR
jgi:hypothetical protein